MSIEYKRRYDDEGEAVRCSACGYPAPVSNFPIPPHKRGCEDEEDDWFCEFCATTLVSNTFSYPNQHSDATSALAVAHAFNAIVDGLGIDRSKLWGRS